MNDLVLKFSEWFGLMSLMNDSVFWFGSSMNDRVWKSLLEDFIPQFCGYRVVAKTQYKLL